MYKRLNAKSLTLVQGRQQMEIDQSVLILEDEPAVARLLVRMLEKRGYSTLLTSTGQETVSVYKKYFDLGSRFAIVLMDLSPDADNIGAVKALTAIKEFDPEVKAIVVSGECGGEVMTNFTKYGFVGCLSKPFTALELCELLKNFVKQGRLVG